MIVPNFVFGRLSAVEVDRVLEQRRKDLFFRIEFALDIVDRRHRRSSIRKFADSGEPETGWA